MSMLDATLAELWQTGQWQMGLAALRIAHHVPGRIRLKLRTSAGLDGLPQASLMSWVSLLTRVLEHTAGVRSVHLNLLARSCVLEYDPAVIPQQAWTELLAGVDSAAAGVLQAHLLNSYREVVHAKL
ncbi:heavy-metal-associated domain-containing protein [Azomonas macrocytogenes]|uniref:Uncharacterized protein n=1 Tax=Azomonas macrocytogenes TaxID=69962 RepID=A0A839T228_AZOMA|nr:heavy metal-associated domain-containing protein [Azomonas macrocytogenes]MBB3103158.1 hypothetical protein [Azomonas macrocytogenes]